MKLTAELVAKLSAQSKAQLASDLQSLGKGVPGITASRSNAIPNQQQQGGLLQQILGGDNFKSFFTRYMIGRSALDSIGVGGGMGRLGGIALANLAGQFPKLAAVVAVATVALEVFHMALKQAAEAVQRGNKLYLDAARIGRPVSSTFLLQQALASQGLPPEMADQLALRAQGGGGNVWRGSVGGIQLAASGAGGAGLTNELRNLMPDLNNAVNDFTVDAVAMSASARNLKDIFYEFFKFKTEWNTLWSQFASQMAPLFRAVFTIINGSLRITNLVLVISQSISKVFTDLLQVLLDVMARMNIPLSGAAGNLLSRWRNRQDDANQSFGVGAVRPGNITGLERMGLVIGSANKSENYLKDIAKNTASAASALNSGKGKSDSPFTQFSLSYSNGQ